MPAAVAQAAAVIGGTAGLARLGGSTGGQAIKSAGVALGLTLVSQWLRPPSDAPGAAREAPYPALTPRFVLGRSLVPVAPCFGIVKGGSLHLAVPVSIGTCEGMGPEIVIEGGWNSYGSRNPTEVPLKRDGRLWKPFPGAANAFADRLRIWEYPEAARSTKRWESLRAVAPGWDADHRMDGIAGIHIELRQGDRPANAPNSQGRFWTGIPAMRVLWKGIKPTWPGHSAREWTDSPAALRYWWMVERLGVDPDLIDSESVRAAHGICSETLRYRLPERHAAEYESASKRYSVNGWFAPTDTRAQVEQQMDLAWLGEVLLADGRFRFLPGAPRPATRSILPRDLVANLEVVVSGQPSDRLTGASCVLAQSRDKRFRGEQALRYEDDDAKALIGGVSRVHDLGRLSFVDDPLLGMRLLAYLVRQARNDRRWRYRVRPGDGIRHFGALPGDVIKITEPENDLLSTDCEIVSTDRGDDWSADWQIRRVMDWSVLPVLPEASGKHDTDLTPTPPVPPIQRPIHI